MRRVKLETALLQDKEYVQELFTRRIIISHATLHLSCAMNASSRTNKAISCSVACHRHKEQCATEFEKAASCKASVVSNHVDISLVDYPGEEFCRTRDKLLW